MTEQKANIVNLQPLFVLPSIEDKYKINFNFLLGFLLLELFVIFIILYIFFKTEVQFTFWKTFFTFRKQKLRSNDTRLLFKNIKKIFTIPLKCMPVDQNKNKYYICNESETLKLLNLDKQLVEFPSEEKCLYALQGDIDNILN